MPQSWSFISDVMNGVQNGNLGYVVELLKVSQALEVLGEPSMYLYIVVTLHIFEHLPPAL